MLMAKKKKRKGATNMFKRLKEGFLIVACLTAFMAVGCASLGGKITVPEPPEEKLAFAEATLTGLTLAAVQLNNAQLITLEKAKEIENIITKTELAIRLGRVALNGKDADTALSRNDRRIDPSVNRIQWIPHTTGTASKVTAAGSETDIIPGRLGENVQLVFCIRTFYNTRHSPNIH